jgi:hypothetical protein
MDRWKTLLSCSVQKVDKSTEGIQIQRPPDPIDLGNDTCTQNCGQDAADQVAKRSREQPDQEQRRRESSRFGLINRT